MVFGQAGGRPDRRSRENGMLRGAQAAITIDSNTVLPHRLLPPGWKTPPWDAVAVIHMSTQHFLE